jgi:exosome complex component RRP42
LPKLISEGDQDPLFDDDWEASTYLYPSNSAKDRAVRPTISLLVIAVGNNILFDPSKEELAVAESVMAVSIGFPKASNSKTDIGRILSMRSIDPPSRLTPPGIPNSVNTTTTSQQFSVQEITAARESSSDQGVWNPPRGGLPRLLVKRIMSSILGPDGIIRDIVAGLDAGV